MESEPLAAESYERDGVWFTVDHRRYDDQAMAGDPEYRRFVDDMIRARPEHSGLDDADVEREFVRRREQIRADQGVADADTHIIRLPSPDADH